MRRRVEVVGAGPNGLAAALVLQEAGCQVRLRERLERCGGGLRSAALTLPGYQHDVCAAVLPLAAASPFFRSLRLELEWIQPRYALAHPFDDGTAAVLERDPVASAASLDAADRAAYPGLLAALGDAWGTLAADVLAPLHWPARPGAYARFARLAALPARRLAHAQFRGERARALFAGLAAHGTLPLERSPSAAFGLVLALCAHGAGWPLARGGSQRIADALEQRFRRAGGTVRTGADVTTLEGLEDHPVVLDVSPRALLALARPLLREREVRQLGSYRYGPGIHKVDWALRSPIPWRAVDCAAAGTVHLGGSEAEIARALRAAAAGEVPETPFVLLGQPTQFDASRAPAGGHIAWAYCAVPFGCTADVTPALEAQVERFAPGFRERIAARHVRTAAQLDAYSPNLVGGSIGGGVHSLRQFFLGPLPGRSPYRVRRGQLYLCSAATPPGPGVHGMCGQHAARSLLADLGVV